MTRKRHPSDYDMAEQLLDIGMRMERTGTVPTAEQLQRRYGLSRATAYRRCAAIMGYLNETPRDDESLTTPSPE